MCGLHSEVCLSLGMLVQMNGVIGLGYTLQQVSGKSHSKVPPSYKGPRNEWSSLVNDGSDAFLIAADLQFLIFFLKMKISSFCASQH